MGLTSRRASYVVSCTMGTSWSRARSAESSLSAMPSAGRRRQQRRGHQHDPDPRLRQALVDSAEQRLAEANVLLAEPDRDTACLEQIVQLLGGPLPVVPRVAEKDVPKVRQGRSLLDGVADWRECPHFVRRVQTETNRLATSVALCCGWTRRRCSGRPRCSPTRSRTGTSRTGASTTAAVAAVAAIAATACRAVRCSARCAMASYWCCASSHVDFSALVPPASSVSAFSRPRYGRDGGACSSGQASG